MDNAQLVSLPKIKRAQKIIGDRLHRTPIVTASTLGELFGVQLFLKLELFQKTGSFKPRGVLNKLHHLSVAEKERGVVSLSAGNHAQALAWGASQENISSTIFMPAKSSQSKVQATKNYGGKVVLTEGNLLEECLEMQRKYNMTLVHPFDDPYVIAGQGTIGLEIIDDLKDVDTVIVSIGGGGLISGVAAAIKQVKPGVRIIGVEPEGADAMTSSLKSGKPEHLPSVNTIADGLAAPFAGKHTLAHVQEFVDEVIIVGDDEIRESLVLLMERTKVLPEPAAAAALSPLQFNKIVTRPGEKVLSIICGGNIDRNTLKNIL